MLVRRISGIALSVGIIGFFLVMTPVSASAFSTAAAATINPVFAPHPLVVKPGGTVNAPTTTLTFTDNSATHVWAAGDQITFQMWDAVTHGPLGVTSLTIPTVAASDGFTGFSVTPARSASSAFNDEFVLSLNQEAPLDANSTSFTLTGLAATLSPTDMGASHIELRALASNGTPFKTPGPTPSPTNAAYAAYGYVAGISVSVVTPTTAHAGQQGVVVGPILLSGYYDGDIVSGDTVNLTLSGGTWAAAPSWSGSPSIGPITGVGTQTLRFTALANSTANSPLTLAGAVIDLPADTASVSVSLTNGGEWWNGTPLTTVASTSRVAGTDRYTTATALFDLPQLPRSDAVLTSGVNFPDALSAAYLARQLPTGVLTTDPNSLPNVTRQLIIREDIQNIYVVGGPASVSDAVLAQLQQIHIAGSSIAPLIHVVRISGADRYATNGAVDRYPGRTASTVLIATGEDFADALAAGPVSYRENYPLVLVPPSGLGDAQKATLTALGAKSAIILGGTKAVPVGVEQQLAAMGVTVVQRLAGNDRAETAGLIASWETDGIPARATYAGLPKLNFMIDSVFLARGDGFADALAAGPIAGMFGTPIVLTASPNALGQGATSYLTSHHLDVSRVQAIGGTAAVSDSTLSAAVAALG